MLPSVRRIAVSLIADFPFDDRGQMMRQTDALERVTRYACDAAGHRTARVLPRRQRESFAYALTAMLDTLARE